MNTLARSSGFRSCTVILACGLLACAPLRGQLFDLGIKGGVSLDDLNTSYEHQGLIGGHVGLFARVKPPVWPGVQGELLLSSFGANVTAEGHSGDLRSLAIHAPLFVVLALGPAELHGGAYYERYLTRSLATEFNINLDDVPLELGRLNDDGYGLLVGAGVRFGGFYAGARYNIGLSPLGSGPYLADVHTRQFQGYIGLGFFRSK